MAYKISFEDYYDFYLSLTKEKEYKNNLFYYRLRVYFIFLIACIFSLSISNNGIFLILYGFLIIPLWFLTKKLSLISIKETLTKTIKANPFMLVERKLSITDNSLIIECDGIKLEIDFKNILEVRTHKDIIIIKCTDTTRIVPFNAFNSETEKGAFLDTLKEIRRSV